MKFYAVSPSPSLTSHLSFMVESDLQIELLIHQAQIKEKKGSFVTPKCTIVVQEAELFSYSIIRRVSAKYRVQIDLSTEPDLNNLLC